MPKAKRIKQNRKEKPYHQRTYNDMTTTERIDFTRRNLKREYEAAAKDYFRPLIHNHIIQRTSRERMRLLMKLEDIRTDLKEEFSRATNIFVGPNNSINFVDHILNKRKSLIAEHDCFTIEDEVKADDEEYRYYIKCLIVMQEFEEDPRRYIREHPTHAEWRFEI